MKKDKEWAIKEAKETINGFFDRSSRGVAQHYEDELIASIADIINQLDEPEVLSKEWIDENKEDSGVHYIGYYVPIGRLHDLIVPKREEVDRAYKDGYDTGKEHTFYKGYLEGLADKESEPETVADVVTTFWKSCERLKEVMSMEIEELEE